MPDYEIIFKPGSASDKAAVDKVVTADGYFQSGRFFHFYTGGNQLEGGPRILISAGDVLQIKERHGA